MTTTYREETIVAKEGTLLLTNLPFIVATPNSGKAILKMTGTVYNRDMTNISDGGVQISAEDKKRFTDGYYAFDLKADAVKQKLQELGLLRRQNETDIEFVKRACFWLAKNKTFGSGSHGPNSAKIFDQSEQLNCNGASKTLVAILRNNGVVVKANPRLFLLKNGENTLHSDISVYISDEKKWIGISGAGLISGGRDMAIQNGVSGKHGSFGKDIDTGFNGIFIDMADDVGHLLIIPDISRFYSYFNDQVATWSKVGTKAAIRGRAEFTFTHKFTPIDIQNLPGN